MAYEYESKETRVLKTIDSSRYPDSNKDFEKNIRRLNSSVDYISSYMRVMQAGIDDANKSFIEQIQSFINDLVVLFAGGEPTGIEIGDLKYVIQAIGALFGFNGPFPVNLINAVQHFFTGYLGSLVQLSDLVFDAIEAWMQDLIDNMGDIPIIGGAVTTLAQFIINASNFAQQGIQDAADAFAHAGEIIDLFLESLGVPTLTDVKTWFTNLFQGFFVGVDFGDGFDLADAATVFINIVLTPVNLLAKLVNGFLLANNIPLIDASKIGTGQFAMSMIQGLGAAITNLANGIAGIIEGFLTALGLPTFDDVVLWFQNLFQGLLYGIDFGDGFDLVEAATWLINFVLLPVNLIAKLVGGFIESLRIPGLDASKITSGTFAQTMIAGLGTALSNLTKFINDVIDAVESAFRGIPVVGSGIANMIDGLQTFFNGLFGQPTPQPTIKDAAVPTIDASKVGTGELGVNRIPNISTDKLTSGRIPGGRIALNTLDDSHITATGLTGTALAAGSVTAAKIADGNVTAAKVADGNITAAKIADGNITAAKVADGNITSAKLGANAVTTAKLGVGAVDSTALGANAVTNAKIAADAVGTSQIATDAVTNAKIATDAVTGNEIAAEAVSSTELATNAVTSAKILDAAVTGSKTTTLDASKITTGTIGSARLPAGLGTVGSGVVLNKTTGTYATLHGQNRLPSGFYNSVPANTSDIEVLNLAGGNVGIKTLNAGWYMFELGYQLTTGAGTAYLNYRWDFTPILYKSDTAGVGIPGSKWGTNAVWINYNAFSLDGKGMKNVQNSFIEYMAAGQIVYPGYIWRADTSPTPTSASIIEVSLNGFNTYFSGSLLNRSLA